MDQLEEILERMKNHSTNSCRNAETLETSKDSDVCPICEGREWILKIKDGVEIAVPCKCREKAVMSRRLRFADIPEAFRGMDLRSFRMDVYRKQESKKMVSDACKIIKTYLDDFESQKERGMGLYIWSRTKGSGKTRIAAGIANELMKNYAVKFAVSLTILQEIKNTWRRDTECSENQLLDALYTTDILVIDDFGVERPADWINDKMYQIINERYINRKVTIFTSNDPLETLQYDDRITNRIKERTYQIAFPEESIRDHIAERMQEEIIEKMMAGGNIK
nr:MAG TPA: Replicative helicase [Caudoviricetes sp.]